MHYRLSFRYTKNILNADAFGSQVTGINLYLFDQDGKLAYHKTEDRALTEANDYYIDVDVRPGKYDIIAWCEGKSITDNPTSFVIENAANPSSISDLGAYLPLQDAEDGHYSDRDINRFYHGLKTDVDFPDSYGIVNIDPIYLTKDTNHITIQLQNAGSQPLDPSILSIELSSNNNPSKLNNSSLDWQNGLTGAIGFKYIPWSMKSTSSTTPEVETKADDVTAIPNGVQAELTTGRIMADVEQNLTIRRTDTDETIFSIPLVEYLLLVRGNYVQASSDQDYLDRYDDFTMVFFLQDGYTWLKTRVLINGWRVVLNPDTEL